MSTYLSAATRIKLQRIIDRKEDGGYPDDMLTRLECDRLRFAKWRYRELCPCGYPDDEDNSGCRCLTDPADEIAH